MSADKLPKRGEAKPAGSGEQFLQGTDDGATLSRAGQPLMGEAPDGHPLDAALALLALDCRQVEAPTGLESRLVAAALREMEASSPAQSGFLASPAPAAGGGWWWRAGGALAVAAVMLLALFQMPGWMAAVKAPERPLPGVAAVTVPHEALAMVDAVGKQAVASESATRASVRRANAAGNQPALAQHTRTVAIPGADSPVAAAPEDFREGPSGEAVPPMEWPVEVLVAARQMVEASGFGAAGYGAEAPLQSVRVRMGADDLWRMGLASTPATKNQAVLADFLVTDEGRPLAVRLVGVYP